MTRTSAVRWYHAVAVAAWAVGMLAPWVGR